MSDSKSVSRLIEGEGVQAGNLEDAAEAGALNQGIVCSVFE